MHRTCVAFALAATLAAPASAQIAWDSPALLSHVVPAGVSLFLLAPSGGDLGGLVTFRHEAGPVGLGYRFAIADQNGGGTAVAGGVDISGFLSRAVEGSEIDVMWWSGAGFGSGNEQVLSIPLGALVGWSGQGGDAVLSPYGGAHVVLDLSTADVDNVSFGGVVDLGLDVVLSSGWLVRFGGSVGDRETVAIGVKLPT